jgi:SWI/SNF-related matrix-associated actin-dependent regulator 1 of chromatin subfamily A
VDEFEYFPTINSAVLPPTRNVARRLLEIGCRFDESAQIFLADTGPEMDFKSVDKKFEAYPFQKEGVKIMLDSPGNILLADEMGLGKTVQGALYLKYKKDSLPALIISPASLKENWKKEIKTWTGKNSYIIDGRKPERISQEFLAKYPVLIINYDILGQDNKEDKEFQNKLKAKIKKLKERVLLVKENEKKQHINQKIYMYQSVKRNFKIRVEGWCDVLSQLNFKTIIGDEIQYISGIDTIRTRATQKISFSIPDSKKIFISGTPYETKTLQFFPCLNILDNKHFSNEYRYKMKYCDPEKTRFGWKFDGLSNAEELHRIISKFMIRRLKKDVLKDLPPKVRSVIPMKIKPSDRKMYDRIDGELALAIINKEKNALSKLEALKQASFQAKKESMIQWIKDYLEINDKLVVFIWHRESCEILEKEFKGICVSITGDTPSKKRDSIKEEFQNNPKIKLFIGQIKSAGVGLTLVASKAVAFLEFGSTAPGMEQAEDRVHRIGQKADSVLAYYLTMENSIDEQIMKVLNRRNKDLKKVLNDEDEDLFAPEKELEFSKMILNEYIQDKKLA